MMPLEQLPTWAAILTTVLVVMGAGLTAIGSFGLLRLGSFYERIHAPTLGATLGMGLVLIASMLCFTVLEERPVIHELLISALMFVTTPIGFMLLARAALYRDRAEGCGGVPPPLVSPGRDTQPGPPPKA